MDTPRGLLSPQTGVGVYQEGVHPAAADLSDILAQHWAVRWDLRGRGPHTVEVLPHPAVQLVVEDGRCRIHGILRGRYSHTLDGRGDIFGTAFRPAGFRPLLGRPVTELTDRVVEGSAVFGAAAGELAGRIYDARNVEERIGIAEGFVRGRLTGAVPAAVRTVNGLVDAILADRTILKVDDIVDRYGIGKRNLDRHRGSASHAYPSLAERHGPFGLSGAVLVVSAPAQGAPERRSPTSRLNTSGSLLRARGLYARARRGWARSPPRGSTTPAAPQPNRCSVRLSQRKEPYLAS